jgi:hypothetical protein
MGFLDAASGTDNKILAVCKGDRVTHKNYMWQYVTGGVSSDS